MRTAPLRLSSLRAALALAALTALCALPSRADAGSTPSHPNIIFILSDDIGYGDVGCYGANKVKTPHLDRLAREGVRFTDAHSTATVCTPTRFAALTGRYAWRQPGTGIAPGNATALIHPGTSTIASLLKQAGYATGMVGKWHLGLGLTEPDFNGDIAPGPVELGFDYAYFFPGTPDRVPCVFIENHRVVGLDPADPIRVSYQHPLEGELTGLDHPELLRIKADRNHSQTIVDGISRIGHMTGGNTALWNDEVLTDALAAQAVKFIERNRSGAPFFLYFATNGIHVPLMPNPRFRGTSGCGWRGDAIHELDWAVGQVLAALDRCGLAGNTLVIFGSDNGGVLQHNYFDGTNDLYPLQPPNGVLRGFKGSLYEGGHRTPLIVRWPGHARAGAESDQLVALIDLYASFASLTGQTPPPGAAPDSVDVMPALLGQPGAKGRRQLVLQNENSTPLALRADRWMLIETGQGHELYNVAADLSETRNLAADEPERVRQLAAELDAIRRLKNSD